MQEETTKDFFADVRIIIDNKNNYVAIQTADKELYKKLLDFFSERNLSKNADFLCVVEQSFKVTLDSTTTIYFDLVKLK
ncbi:MAG: hypothetical protein JTT12_05690 [Candidatus Brockarchaeota archaeon]|nr:hypothetical protein [Candidatus Brockarchaeota archaeon]